MVRRAGSALLIVAMLAAMPARGAAPIDEDRRARDQFTLWTFYDDDSGHNHFQLQLFGPPDEFGANDYTNRVSRITITTSQPQADGTIHRRTFEAPVDGSGGGGFTEGPCVACGPYQLLFFALPHDFGDSYAIIDARLSLTAAEGDCSQAALFAACGGGVSAYLNPTIFGVPNPFNESYGDAIPYPYLLH